MKLALTLTGVVFMMSWGSAQASFVDDGTELSKAIPAIRSAIGNHPRILRIEVEPNDVIVEAQDPKNPTHVNRWRCVNHIGIIPIQWVFGPEPVDLQLLDPDLEANLFDLDAVAFSATAKLENAAIERTHIQDRAVATRMEVARQTFILPKPTTGDVRWTLHITSGREHADVFANAQGDIIGADLGDTQRAQTLNLFKEPELIVDAAAAFRSAVGADPVLTSVGISGQRVGFLTNMADNRLGKLGGGLAQVANFTWDLNGLRSGLPGIDSSAITQRLTQAPAPAPFSVNDVDWSIAPKLEADALAKVNLSQAQITDDPSNGGNPATFDLAADGVSRASMTFTLNSQGPRFGVADLASITEQKVAALEAEAMKRLGGNKQVYLESVTIGPHLIVRKAGARANEVRDSVRAEYGWIVYDFNGRSLDSANGW